MSHLITANNANAPSIAQPASAINLSKRICYTYLNKLTTATERWFFYAKNKKGLKMQDSDDFQSRKKGIRFDATINLGHILTFFGFMFSGFIAWSAIDSRVVVLEQATKFQSLRDSQQDVLLQNQNQHINEKLVEIKRAVERINDKIEVVQWNEP